MAEEDIPLHLVLLCVMITEICEAVKNVPEDMTNFQLKYDVKSQHG